MATPLGTNVVTAIVRQHILPTVVDNVYNSNPLFFRINKSKRFVRGGTQIEVPVMYSRFSNGGAYSGYDSLNVAPNDTVKTIAFDWKQYYVPVSLDGLTLIKTDSPDAIADIIKLQFAQAEMEMAENIGADFWSMAGNAKAIDSLATAVDSSGTYGGIARSTNTWWASNETGTSQALTNGRLQAMFSASSEGGRHPSIIVSGQDQYDRYWAIGEAKQSIQQGPVAYDEQLYSAGFTNLIFNGVPWVVDSHVTNASGVAGGTDTTVYMLNEDYLYWAVSPRADMTVEDFQTPITQDAMSTKMLWAGNLLVTNCKRQAKHTGFNA